jgi:TRAP transporter TAXI family solute receptor
MKKKLYFLSALILVAMLFGQGAFGAVLPPAKSQSRTETHKSVEKLVGSSFTSGATYQWSVAACTTVSKYSEWLTLSPVTTTGSAENILLVQANDAAFGTCNAANAYFAYTGSENWTSQGYKPMPDLKILWSLYADYFQTMVPANSDINNMEDLRGKRVSFGPRGGGMEVTTVTYLTALGLIDDVEIMYMPTTDCISAIQEGILDCYFFTGGVGSSGGLELAASQKGLKIIPFTEEECQKIHEVFPIARMATMPAGAYPGLPEIRTLSASACVVATEDSMSADEAYEFALQMDLHLEEVVAAYSHADYSTAENTYTDWIDSIPFHSGTIKYLQEKGIIK